MLSWLHACFFRRFQTGAATGLVLALLTARLAPAQTAAPASPSTTDIVGVARLAFPRLAAHDSTAMQQGQKALLVVPAAGAGLRLRLNKTSNTNLCIDYGFGADGSHGLSLNLGEVF